MNNLSIIIPFHQNKKMLLTSLRTLSESLSDNFSGEIIVVANNLDKEKINLELNPHIYKTLYFNKNLFYPEAIRQGARVASGDYLVFADPDIFYCNNWLENMLYTYHKKDSIGGVGAKLLNPINNHVMDMGIGYQGYHTIHIMRGLPYDHNLCSHDIEVQSVCSALFLVKHSIYDTLEGMDAEMPYAYCDNDFCLRLREAGYQIMVSAKAIAYHKGSTDNYNSKYYAFQYLREDSAAAFYYKNRNRYTDDYLKYINYSYSFFKDTIKEKGYLFINLSTVNDWHNYMLCLQYIGIKVLDVYEYTIPKRNTDILDLTNILDIFLVSSKTPIIYFTDTFESCYGNSLWFSMRDISNDVVMDRNANIIPCRYIANYLL